MSEPTVFTCPSCGASLDISLKQANAKCHYCGNTILVPREPANAQDLQSEQMAIVNNAIQSAMDLESKQMSVATGVAKWSVGLVVGGTIIVPLILTALTFVLIICIFGFVWYSFGSMFSFFR